MLFTIDRGSFNQSSKTGILCFYLNLPNVLINKSDKILKEELIILNLKVRAKIHTRPRADAAQFQVEQKLH